MADLPISENQNASNGFMPELGTLLSELNITPTTAEGAKLAAGNAAPTFAGLDQFELENLFQAAIDVAEQKGTLPTNSGLFGTWTTAPESDKTTDVHVHGLLQNGDKTFYALTELLSKLQ